MPKLHSHTLLLLLPIVLLQVVDVNRTCKGTRTGGLYRYRCVAGQPGQLRRCLAFACHYVEQTWACALPAGAL